MASKQEPKGLTEFNNVLNDLINVIKAANHAAPGFISIAMVLAIFTVAIITLYSAIGLCINLSLILFTSILVYYSTRKYGEASIALSTGLLALFSVNWDTEKTILFFIAWVSFSLAAFWIMTISSIANKESILKEAAISITTTDITAVEKDLDKLIKKANVKKFGPIESAEIIRLFSYRKLPIESMEYALNAVGTMTSITGANHITVAIFVIDIYKMFGTLPGPRYQKLLDRVYHIMRESPISPSEFIIAYNQSRHIALSGSISPEKYFELLQAGLEKGVSPTDIHLYLETHNQVAK